MPDVLNLPLTCDLLAYCLNYHTVNASQWTVNSTYSLFVRLSCPTNIANLSRCQVLLADQQAGEGQWEQNNCNDCTLRACHTSDVFQQRHQEHTPPAASMSRRPVRRGIHSIIVNIKVSHILNMSVGSGADPSL